MTLLVWKDFLRIIKAVSEAAQNTKLNITLMLSLVKSALQQFRCYRGDPICQHFQQKLSEAKQICHNLNLPDYFSLKRTVIRKRMAGEIAEHESVANPEDRFRIQFYNVVLDSIITELEERFESVDFLRTSRLLAQHIF
jgi:hypothetical protein